MPDFRGRILFIFTWMLFCFHGLEADHHKTKEPNPSHYVKDSVWKKVNGYLLPNDHPAKSKLDEIFSRSRAIFDQASMTAAGFDAYPPQHHTQMIVAKHPEIEGYVIKTYLDVQDYYREIPEEYLWMRRIKGRRLIQRCIDSHHYNHLFKVPQKWIYLLPDNPSPPSGFLRKRFVLIAEDMNLLDQQANENLWGSEKVTRDFLSAFYTILTELTLHDSAKPNNCPFSVDGKAAFVDTEHFHMGYVNYFKLAPFLSPPMNDYWNEITQKKEKTPVRI